MSRLFSLVERELYKDLKRGGLLKDLKRDYQIKHEINARQFNSIHINLKGKIESRTKTYQEQIKNLSLSIKALTKRIKSLVKKIKKTPPSCGLNGKKSERGYLKWLLHQKKRSLDHKEKKLEHLKAQSPSLIFGGRKLWSAQFNHLENGYDSHLEWKEDWQKKRSSQFMLVGSGDETGGNQNCQLTGDALKIRVPKVFEETFGKYYSIEGVKFPYGKDEINYALNNKKALTFRFVRIEKGWYLFATLELPSTPTISYRRNGMLGIDLNPGVIGWSYCDGDGNLLEKGQIRINIQDKNKNQTSAILGDAVKQLVEIASKYQCPIAVESLDFERKKASMKEMGIKYCRMLSNFAYSRFIEMLVSRADKYGIETIKVNPAYSSIIGCSKFMSMYGLSSDTAAALVIARRALRFSERIPPIYARLVQVDSARHVWSSWNVLGKKLKGVLRHNFFESGANSPLEVNLFDEPPERSDGRSKRKRFRTSRRGWDSPALVDNTARSTVPTYIQLSLF